MERIRVLIADDLPVFRVGLQVADRAQAIVRARDAGMGQQSTKQ